MEAQFALPCWDLHALSPSSSLLWSEPCPGPCGVSSNRGSWAETACAFNHRATILSLPSPFPFLSRFFFLSFAPLPCLCQSLVSHAKDAAFCYGPVALSRISSALQDKPTPGHGGHRTQRKSMHGWGRLSPHPQSIWKETSLVWVISLFNFRTGCVLMAQGVSTGGARARVGDYCSPEA